MPDYVWRGSHDLRRPTDHIAPGERFDPTESELRAYGDLIEAVEPEPETCQTVKSDGEVCGRELPCQYHTED